MALTTERQNGSNGKMALSAGGKLACYVAKSTTIKGDHTDNKK